jgi:hypothetical protein
MISKELLSEVLGVDIVKFDSFSSSILDVEFKRFSHEEGIKLNIYELAHKCKEWAYRNNYGISVHTSEISGYIVEIQCCFSVTNFHNMNEPEAIFKACQWILENRGK